MTDTTEMFGPEWTLRATIARARAGETIALDVLRILRRAHRDIAEEIAALALDSPTRARYVALLDSLEPMLAEAYDVAHNVAKTGLAQVEKAERVALAGLTVPPPNEIPLALGTQLTRARVVHIAAISEVFDDIPLFGIKFGAWWREGARKAFLRVQNEVQAGLVRGENPVAIARRVFHETNGRRSQIAGGNAYRASVKAMRTIVRTVTTHVQTRAALDSMRASGITRVRFDAVLDARTSLTCAALDDNEYAIDDPAIPLPPIHPNCRSVLVPVVTWAAGPRAGQPVMKRSGQSYEQWLREQPEATQNEILGKSRAHAWRQGYVALADLISSADGRVLRLNELAEHLRPR